MESISNPDEFLDPTGIQSGSYRAIPGLGWDEKPVVQELRRKIGTILPYNGPSLYAEFHGMARACSEIL